MAADGPIRTCIGCRARRSQPDLVRFHLDEHARLRVGRTGPGRGAWLCGDQTARCLASALRANAFARAFGREPDRASLPSHGVDWPSIERQLVAPS